MLSRVYFDKAFCGIALNEQIGAVPAQDKPFVTKVFTAFSKKTIISIAPLNRLSVRRPSRK